MRDCLGLALETEPGHGAARTGRWHRGQVRKRQGVTYDMGRARALAEAAIREAAQVRNHPPEPHWRPPRENGGCFCLVSSM